MKDITKQNFRYCLAESQGRGCLCAAMFHLKCGTDNNLILNFKADDTSYGFKTRSAWLVGYPGEYEMEAFYKMHKSTFDFLEKTFPNEDWYLHYHKYDDETMSCYASDVPNRTFPDQSDPNFWKMQFEITKKMWDNGFINGNYPQGHYMISNEKLVLAVSYFGFKKDQLLTEQEIAAFNSCHKIQKDNKKKNWFIKHYVHNKDAMRNLLSTDLWRLTCASQLGSDISGFDDYLKANLEMIGPSENQEINTYINACLRKNTLNFEIEYEEFQ